ncbi:MAG: tyrosine-type recombinase/integrase, partial [Candidatus Heimdallarchaeaceae archaeon]
LFLNTMKEESLSQESYNHYLTIIKVYANWLSRRSIIGDASFLQDYRGFTNPEQVRKKKYYPEDQVKLFLQVRPRWLHYFLFLGFYFGFRPNEIARLELQDINLEQKYIDVRSSVQKVSKQDYLAIPDIFTNKFHELLTWRNRQVTDQLFLIVSSRGKQISRANLDSHRQKLLAIDSDFRFYNTRYTAAWRAYKQTKNIYIVQQLLRHTRPAETVTYLGIQLEELLATQRQDMEKIFTGVSL